MERSPAMSAKQSPAMSAKQRSRRPTVLERQRAEEEAALKAQLAANRQRALAKGVTPATPASEMVKKVKIRGRRVRRKSFNAVFLPVVRTGVKVVPTSASACQPRGCHETRTGGHHRTHLRRCVASHGPLRNTCVVNHREALRL